MNDYDVIVIGGGHNGLTTATLLARAGRRVLLVERRDRFGGLAAGEEFHPGYHTAGVLCDTTLVRGSVLQALGLARYGVQRDARHPAVLLARREGRGLLLHRDPAAAADELGAHSAADVRNYQRYREFARRGGRVLRRLLDAPPPDTVHLGAATAWPLLQSGWALRRLGRRDMMTLLRSAPMSLADWLGEWFESPLLQAGLAAPALYGTWLGPRSPGGASNLWALEAATETPITGGAPVVVEALLRAAKDVRVVLRCAATVERIRTHDTKVCGVTLAGGEQIDAPVVAASCDPKQTLLELLPPAALPAPLDQRIRGFRARGTTAVVHLALNRPLQFDCRSDESPAWIRIGEHPDDLERAFDAAKYRRLPEAPVLDVHVPSVVHPASAPAGHGVATIAAHFVPFDLEGGWTNERRRELQDGVLKLLEMYASGVTASVVAARTLTPQDLHDEYGLTGGHVHHGEQALDQRLNRPVPECARYATPIAGLYLCGSGSHPGGGLTGMPGMLAAETILRRR